MHTEGHLPKRAQEVQERRVQQNLLPREGHQFPGSREALAEVQGDEDLREEDQEGKGTYF